MSIRPDAIPAVPERPRVFARHILALFGCGLALAWSWSRLRESDPKTALLRAATQGPTADRERAVGELGDRAPEEIAGIVPGLIRALGDIDPGVREQGVLSLGRSVQFATLHIRASGGPEGDVALNAIAGRRADWSPRVRRAVAMSVSLCISPAREAPSHRLAAETLRDLSRDRVATVRFAAAVALEDPGFRCRETREAFVAATVDPDPAVRLLALRYLRRQRVETPMARLAYSRAFDSDDPYIHAVGEAWIVANADRLDLGEVVPRLLARIAVRHLDRPTVLGPAARDPRRELNGNGAPADDCMSILGWLGPRASSATPVLAAWGTRPGRNRLRVDAARVLGVIAPGSAEARSALSLLLEDLGSEIGSDRWMALGALGSYTWDLERVVPTLSIIAQGLDVSERFSASGSLEASDRFERPRERP